MKAVLFDVYETILTGRRAIHREALIRQVLDDFNLQFPARDSISEALDSEIREAHRNSSLPYPEVDVRKIWMKILPELRSSDDFSEAVENAIHPVTLMPGAEQCLTDLAQRGVVLGILSNAQAYTRRLLEKLLGPLWDAFSKDLVFFSYEYCFSKPTPELFEAAIAGLESIGIRADEAMMVGDSLENDILPARRLGLQTRHITTRQLPILTS